MNPAYYCEIHALADDPGTRNLIMNDPEFGTLVGATGRGDPQAPLGPQLEPGETCNEWREEHPDSGYFDPHPAGC
jgi:hypothetical protein